VICPRCHGGLIGDDGSRGRRHRVSGSCMGGGDDGASRLVEGGEWRDPRVPGGHFGLVAADAAPVARAVAVRTRTATGPVDNRLHLRAIATGPEAAGPPAASGPVFSWAVPPPEHPLISPTGQGSRRRERRARGTAYRTSMQVELTLTSSGEAVVFR